MILRLPQNHARANDHLCRPIRILKYHCLSWIRMHHLIQQQLQIPKALRTLQRLPHIFVRYISRKIKVLINYYPFPAICQFASPSGRQLCKFFDRFTSVLIIIRVWPSDSDAIETFILLSGVCSIVAMSYFSSGIFEKSFEPLQTQLTVQYSSLKNEDFNIVWTNILYIAWSSR